MQQLKRILVARMGRIGDMVMISPAMQAILEKFPHAKITLLTTSDGKRAFNGFSDRLDKIIIYNRKSLIPWLTRRNIINKLKLDSYDQIYCFESNPSFLTLFDNLNSNLHTLESITDKSIHYSQYCLNLVNPENTHNKMAFTLKLPVTEKAKTGAGEQFELLGIQKTDFVIGFHPSFSGLAKSFGRAQKHAHHKVWPIQYWSELAVKIQLHATTHNLNVKIMMDMVPEEHEIGAEINRLSKDAALFQCPSLNFERYKATIARYDLLITPNSGPMHIAAAVGTKVIALFSLHTPSDCQPFVSDEQFSVIRAEDMKQPKNGLAAIHPDDVFEACCQYLPDSS